MSLFSKISGLFSNSNKPDSSPSSILPALTNPYILPSNVDDFKEWHIKVLRRLDKHPKNKDFSGIMAKEVDIPRFIPILEDLGLLATASFSESLSLLKLDELKMILKEHDLKSSGKKQELIERIILNIDKTDVQHSDVYTEHYVLTDFGHVTVANLTKRLDEDHLRFFRDTMESIVNLDICKAYRMVCKRNSELPIPPGLGVDWRKRYFDGLSWQSEQQYRQLMNSGQNPYIAAASIYADISGETLRNVEMLLSKAYPNLETSANSARIKSTAHSIQKDLFSLTECGTSKYVFLAALDATTCPICGALDGKVFDVKNATIGKNYPPMHDKCRCTVISYDGFKNYTPTKRRARNPVTGKSELVPGNVTYNMWIKNYIDKPKK